MIIIIFIIIIILDVVFDTFLLISFIQDILWLTVSLGQLIKIEAECLLIGYLIFSCD